MSINYLYHTWIGRVKELRPKQRITQVRNFVWLIIGTHIPHLIVAKLANKKRRGDRIGSFTPQIAVY